MWSQPRCYGREMSTRSRAPASTRSCASAIRSRGSGSPSGYGQRAVARCRRQCARRLPLRGDREVVAPKQADGDVGPEQRSKRKRRPVLARPVGGDDRVVGGDRGVEVDVVREGNLDDAVYAVGGVSTNLARRVGLVQRDDMRGHGRVDRLDVAAAPHGCDDLGAAPARELRSERAHAAEYAVHEHRRAGHRPVAEHRPVRGDTWDAQARAHFVADFFRELDSLLGGHHGQLRGGAERAIRLGTVDPDSLTDATGVHTFPRAFDDARAVAVRDNARKRHPETEPVDALLRVAGIDAGKVHPHPDFSGTRLRRGKVAHPQHFRGRALLVVPCGPHHRALQEAGAESRSHGQGTSEASHAQRRPLADRGSGRRADARARRGQELRPAATVHVPRGCGEIGIRASFRCSWG